MGFNIYWNLSGLWSQFYLQRTKRMLKSDPVFSLWFVGFLDGRNFPHFFLFYWTSFSVLWVTKEIEEDSVGTLVYIFRLKIGSLVKLIFSIFLCFSFWGPLKRKCVNLLRLDNWYFLLMDLVCCMFLNLIALQWYFLLFAWCVCEQVCESMVMDAKGICLLFSEDNDQLEKN